MTDIKIIDDAHKDDINIPNEPFQLIGKMIPSYTDEQRYLKTIVIKVLQQSAARSQRSVQVT